MQVDIYRFYADVNQSSGVLIVTGEGGFPLFTALSLERGSNGNKRNESSIPAGTYKMVFEYSPKFDRNLWEIKGVKGRSECKFHPANYWHQLNGCIALGLTYNDINKDGYKDVTSSKDMINEFHKVLKGQTEVELNIY